MKIALASFLFEVEIGGGAAAVVQMLAHQLVEQDFQVVVITTQANQPIRVERSGRLTIYRFFPKNLYWVAQKDSQLVWKKGLWQLIDLWNPFVYPVVKQILTQEQPDLLHGHKLRGLSPAVWTAARAAGVNKIVQTCHDYELMSPEGTLSGPVGNWAGQGSWPLRPYQIIRARLAQSLTAATAPSQYVLDRLTQRGFFQPIQQFVVPNSHGLSKPQLEQLHHQLNHHPQNNPAEPIRLLYLGRLEAVKGVDILCQAFVRSAGRYPRLHLDIAGWGTLAEGLQQQYGQHPQITFHGPLFGPAKAELLKASRVLIAPSVGPEAFGIVIIEALAYGLPVIVARAGGMPELVDEDHTGFIVPAGDTTALAELIGRVAEQPEILDRMGPACLAAAQQYTVEQITQEYLSIYELIRGI
jgi:glycosyltransferase involved in cell wall biosynthesis